MMDDSGLFVSEWTLLRAKLTRAVLRALEKYVVIKIIRYEEKYTSLWERKGASLNTAVVGELCVHISVKMTYFQNTRSM
jgi:hypothetical protein